MVENLVPQPKQRYFVLAGATRSGKSVFINKIFVREVAEEGLRKSMHSTTRTTQNYQSTLDRDTCKAINEDPE